MNAHKILIYTFCLLGMILIHESDGKTCQQNGARSYHLRRVGNPKTWNVRKMSSSLEIRLSFQRNPTTWFFNGSHLYCCHKNDAYYMVVNRDERVELSESSKANDSWQLSHVSKMNKKVFLHESSKMYLTAKSDCDLTAKRKRLCLSKELKHAMIDVEELS